MSNNDLLSRAWRRLRMGGPRAFAQSMTSYCKDRLTPPEWRYHYSIARYSLFSYQFDTDAHPIKPIYVDPAEIKRCTGTKRTVPENPHLDHNHPEEIFSKEMDLGRVVDGDWDRGGCRFDRLELFKGLREHFEERTPWEETVLFQTHASRIQKTGSSLGCQSVRELKQHFQNTDQLFEKIRRDGYRSQKTLSGDPTKEVRVNIGRNGEILFNGGGRHRLSVAKLLNLESIPVLVLVRHQKWQKSKKN